MLHTKSKSQRHSGSVEDFFKGVLSYRGMVAILVMSPRPFEQTFFGSSCGVSIRNLSANGSVVSDEKLFENVEGRRRGP